MRRIGQVPGGAAQSRCPSAKPARPKSGFAFHCLGEFAPDLGEAVAYCLPGVQAAARDQRAGAMAPALGLPESDVVHGGHELARGPSDTPSAGQLSLNALKRHG